MTLQRFILNRRPISDFTLARVVEDMDAIRRDRRNTMTQRDQADGLMFLAEGALRDRHDGRWPACL